MRRGWGEAGRPDRPPGAAMRGDPLHIRALGESDVDALVTVHMAAFPFFYLTGLGSAFLAEYYSLARRYERGIAVGAFEGTTLAGFAVGFADPPQFYRRLREAKVRLAVAALPALLRDPRRVVRFAVNYRRAGSAAVSRETTRQAVELASL